MAGNIVKWWKHKILGGYKQFSVQECTTDSEELMYHQVRASSSCSAPPDLLLVSDRENNIPLRSPVVNIITTSTNASGSSQKHQQHHHHQQQQQHQQHIPQQLQNGTKDTTSKHLKMNSKNSSKLVNTNTSTPQQTLQQQQQQQQQDEVDGPQQSQHQRHSQPPHNKDERIRLEEFTCDVSVEGGKSSQPLQFSFTFYDLDGHHGKITKDDIVGIVYTIYESIGKSVVVPHCGSKTINVRLTVSPEGKSKTSGNKLKKMTANNGGNNGTTVSVLPHANGKIHSLTATSAVGGHGHSGHGHTRRQHRYRPRKLIKSDEEDDDSNSEKEKELANGAAAGGGKSKSSKYNKIKMEQAHQQQLQLQQQQQQQQQQQCCQQQQQENMEQNLDLSTSVNNCQLDNLYENVTGNLKCYAKDSPLSTEDCRGCVSGTTPTTSGNANGHARLTTDIYMKQASTRVKMLRKARKQKYQDHCQESRQRSLSLGSESCWKNRHPMQQIQMTAKTIALLQQQEQEQHVDVIDGVQLRNPRRNPAMLAAAKRNSAECWKTALNRNDLIGIIRESMEKNRLCFQLNGKPQASVSPIRQPQHHQQSQQSQQQHRQRSNTVSKIPTLISNHNNSIINHMHSSNNNNSNNFNINSNNNHNSNNNFELSMHDNSNNSLYHPQPHIPIYHQQMAINPAVLAAQNNIGHNKMNLCGYDSFLHATICGGGTSHSPPPTTTTTTAAATAYATKMISNQPTIQLQYHQQQQLQQLKQPIATVQPLMSAVPIYPNAIPKIFSNPAATTTTTSNQIKTSKILRSGSYSQTHHSTTHNSPQQHGYQRLSSTAQQQQQQHLQQLAATKTNLAALNLQYPSVERSQMEHLAKWLSAREKCHKSKKDAKNYDNLLYARLGEKLQENACNADYYGNGNKENLQRRRHKLQRRQQNLLKAHSADNSSKSTGSSSNNEKATDKIDYIEMLPLNGDPIECENLLGQTTDEETSNELLTPCKEVAAAQVLTAQEKCCETKVHVATGTLVDLTDDAEAVVELQINADGIEICADDEELNAEEEEAEEETESGGSLSPTNVAAIATTGSATNTSASSLIHRYVHEHIHHHYHHFEEKDE